jgi:hypothetical protein
VEADISPKKAASRFAELAFDVGSEGFTGAMVGKLLSRKRGRVLLASLLGIPSHARDTALPMASMSRLDAGEQR